MIAALGFGLLLLQAAPVASPPAYPFQVGEHLEYSAKLGMLRLGSAQLDVARIDTVRGAESFVFQFRLSSHTIFFDADDLMESYTGTADMVSRLFRQDYLENDKRRLRTYQIFPDRQVYYQEGKPDTLATPPDPIDDAAFFYFLRTTPLEVGQTYKYQRYFKLDQNPIQIEVTGREEMELPDGSKVNCLVLHPVVRTDGMFSKRSNTRLWLTDDARRIPVQIRSRFPFGTVTLRLEEMRLGPAPADSVAGG